MPALWPGETIPGYLLRELSVGKLSDVHGYLWLAGRKGNVRPLHRQQIIGRTIVVTERPDLHLVWDKSSMYLKPLPHFLFDHAFFTEHLSSRALLSGETSTLHASACGLLFTYTRLIEHPSDFRIAKDAGLLPPHIDWDAWCTFSEHLRARLHEHAVNRCDYSEPRTRPHENPINQRYKYGEPRASHLNIIFCLLWINPRGFHYVHTRYSSLFRQNFRWLLVVFVYVTLVLTALQTMMTSRYGVASDAVQLVSWLFCALSLMTVAVVVVLMAMVFVSNFVSNLISMLNHIYMRKKKRRIKQETSKV